MGLRRRLAAASLRQPRHEGGWVGNLKSEIANRKSLAPALERFLHFGFGIDTQGVSDAVNVIEIGNDFDGIKDVAVGKAVFA